MRVEQRHFRPGQGWSSAAPSILARPQLVLVFGGRHQLCDGSWHRSLRELWPSAAIVGCSTAGEIAGLEVHDDTIVATAIELECSTLHVVSAPVDARGGSRNAGATLARALVAAEPGLVHSFVLSDGLAVNGSELVDGLLAELPDGVSVTGGLSGDGARFERTTIVDRGEVRSDAVVGVGFYGPRLRVGYGSLGGWDPFGAYRRVTRSAGNVLFELDGKSALALYKSYLGEHARDLPASGLLYPLSVRDDPGGEEVVRTILAVDEDSQSLTFAGDVPEGSEARFMKANFNRLLDGAAGAARSTGHGLHGASPELAILISCVGRKMVLGQRIEEEVEAVGDVLGDRPVITGFYSYGEISPFTPGAKCNLHNQTMTITTLLEE